MARRWGLREGHWAGVGAHVSGCNLPLGGTRGRKRGSTHGGGTQGGGTSVWGGVGAASAPSAAPGALARSHRTPNPTPPPYPHLPSPTSPHCARTRHDGLVLRGRPHVAALRGEGGGERGGEWGGKGGGEGVLGAARDFAAPLAHTLAAPLLLQPDISVAHRVVCGGRGVGWGVEGVHGRWRVGGMGWTGGVAVWVGGGAEWGGVMCAFRSRGRVLVERPGADWSALAGCDRRMPSAGSDQHACRAGRRCRRAPERCSPRRAAMSDQRVPISRTIPTMVRSSCRVHPCLGRGLSLERRRLTPSTADGGDSTTAALTTEPSHGRMEHSAACCCPASRAAIGAAAASAETATASADVAAPAVSTTSEEERPFSRGGSSLVLVSCPVAGASTPRATSALAASVEASMPKKSTLVWFVRNWA